MMPMTNVEGFCVVEGKFDLKRDFGGYLVFRFMGVWRWAWIMTF